MKIVVVVRGGVVQDVVTEGHANVYLLDYDNVTTEVGKHEAQEFSPSVGPDNVEVAFTEWDEYVDELKGE